MKNYLTIFASAMESVRQQKVARLLQKELAEIFRTDSKLHYDGALISVTVVRVASDMSFAKVYLSFFMAKDVKALFEKINEAKWDIRKKVAMKTKGQLRVVPELAFYIDDSLDYAAKIDDLLKK